MKPLLIPKRCRKRSIVERGVTTTATCTLRLPSARSLPKRSEVLPRSCDSNVAYTGHPSEPCTWAPHTIQPLLGTSWGTAFVSSTRLVGMRQAEQVSKQVVMESTCTRTLPQSLCMCLRRLTDSQGNLAEPAFIRKWTTAALDHLTRHACCFDSPTWPSPHFVLLKISQAVVHNTSPWSRMRLWGPGTRYQA